MKSNVGPHQFLSKITKSWPVWTEAAHSMHAFIWVLDYWNHSLFLQVCKAHWPHPSVIIQTEDNEAVNKSICLPLTTVCTFTYPIYCYNMQTRQKTTSLRLSILTATVVTVSAEQSPYAVALTTFPKAPAPRVLPVKTQTLIAWRVVDR